MMYNVKFKIMTVKLYHADFMVFTGFLLS